MPGNELLSNAQSEDVEILAPTFFRAESEGNSRQNAVVVDNEAEPNTNGKEEDPSWDKYPPRDDQNPLWDDENPPSDDEYLSEDCRSIGMEIDSVKGTEIPVSLSSREPTSTPPKSTVDNSPPRMSCDVKAKETVHFTDKVSMTKSEFGDTIERHHIVSDTDSHARSDSSIGQPTQAVSSSTIPKATHQLQSPMKKAKRPGDFTTPEIATSSGDSDGDDSVSENHSTCDTLPTRKRKHPPPAHTVGRKRHSRKSNTTLKRHPERAVPSARRQKPSLFRGRPFSNHSLAIKPTPGARVGACGTKLHGDDSGDEGSEESSDRGCRPRSNERLKSTARLHRSGRHERKRDGGRASRPNTSIDSMEVFGPICLPTAIDSSDSVGEEELSKPQNNEHAPLYSQSETAPPTEPGEDDEYEVEQILEARVYHRRLQYRAKWLGYEDDPEWYDASNFKNSPHKLRDFHTANPTRPGPQKELKRWVRCWEED